MWWYGVGDDGHLRTLAEVQGATGEELHGLAVDPGFADPAAGDYALREDSALRDQGVLVEGVNDDYAGAAPDVGALEYRGSAGCSVACSGTVPTTAQASLPVRFEGSASTSGCTGDPSWDWDLGGGSAHASQASATLRTS